MKKLLFIAILSLTSTLALADIGDNFFSIKLGSSNSKDAGITSLTNQFNSSGTIPSNDLDRSDVLGISIGELNTDLNKKNSKTEGVNSINIVYELLDDSVIKALPILKKLYFFFNSNSDRFHIDLDEIFQIKSKK